MSEAEQPESDATVEEPVLTSDAGNVDATVENAAGETAGQTVATPKSRLPRYLIAALVVGVIISGGWMFRGQWLPGAGDSAAGTPPADSGVEAAPVTTEPATRTAQTTPATSNEATREPPAPTTSAPRQTTTPAIPGVSAAELAAVQTDVDALREALASVNRAIRALEDGQTLQANEARSIRSTIDARVDLLDSLPGRVRNAEEAIATLQGVSTGSRKAWLIAEAEYYLQIANAQLQLANNPQLARAALELADQRVRELADPTYTPVRRQIAAEIASLAGLERADIEGITLTIGSLSNLAATLPLNREIVPDTDAPAADPELTGLARMQSVFSNATSSLFSVRRVDQPVAALLSPEAEYFLRLNVQLQLQAARLSLLLSDMPGYRQSLGDAERWMAAYFDQEDARVTDAIAMIDSIAGVRRNTERPDISASLALLRQQRDISAFGEPLRPGSAAVDAEDESTP
ncbi:MAG: uroporphyrinogen-III C-methyltransferase [Pseudomonadota bacterium]